MGCAAALGLSLLGSGTANAATLDEWLFDVAPTGATFIAKNEVAGGAQVQELHQFVAYQNLQVAGGPFALSVGALYLPTGGDYAAQSAVNLVNWTGRTNFTIELWFNPTGGVSFPNGYEDALAYNGQILRLHPTTGGYNLEGFIRDASTWHSAGTGSILIPSNTWTHLALTYNGSTVKTYVGNQLDQSLSITTTLANDGFNLGIGSFGVQNYAKGYFDEIRVSDVALLPGAGTGLNELAWNATLVPEPTSAALLGLGGLLLVRRRTK